MQSLVVVLLWEKNSQKAIRETVGVGVGVGVLVDLAV